MKTIHIRSKKQHAFATDFYYKVAELTPEKTVLLQVVEGGIEWDYKEDYEETVKFVIDKLCEGQWEEITRENFEHEYKKLVYEINSLTNN